MSGFGSGSNVAQHKPGFEPTPAIRGQDGNHAFKHSDEKDVPLANFRTDTDTSRPLLSGVVHGSEVRRRLIHNMADVPGKMTVCHI